MLKQVDAGVLRVGYHEYGSGDGWPVVLLHGFPYDVHAYDEVAPALAEQGARVVVPYLRGYGPTRFLSTETPRSGEQAALGGDLRALLDALAIPEAILGGYDWGGRAACVVAALWPERASGLVSVNGYNIQDIANSGRPAMPDQEHRLWYQYYFHSERGRAGLEAHRRELCRLLWELWSPTWAFDEATFTQTAESFDNPDFVEVVIHSYRHRFGLVAGDPMSVGIEERLARRPAISVPTVTLDGDADGVSSARSEGYRQRFLGLYEHRVMGGIGHNVPQEAPMAFADAVLTVHRWTAG